MTISTPGAKHAARLFWLKKAEAWALSKLLERRSFFQCVGCGEALSMIKEWRISEVVNGQEHLSTYCAACVAEQGWFKCAGCGKQYFVHDLHGHIKDSCTAEVVMRS